MTLQACRSCKSDDLREVLSLGEMPLANALPTEDQLTQPEARFPLTVVFCNNCTLLQLTETISPPKLFEEYAYFSSRSRPMVEHARSLVAEVIRQQPLDEHSLVVEVASNDGYLLRHYRDAGIPVLGIDPAENVVKVAVADGIPTLCAFFDVEIAEQLRAEGRRADVIHANNVLAHVPNINDFVAAFGILLSDAGVAIIETPYARDLVVNLEFDTIYHEHVFYYTLTALDSLFERNGLKIVHVDHVPIHGGSLRIRAVRNGAQEPDGSVEQLKAEEAAAGIVDFAFYERFAADVKNCITLIRSELRARKAEGRRIMGYGAAAKATVLLNALEIGSDTIDCVVDETPYKQGRFIPGVHIPIVPTDVLRKERPDDVMIFAWNFAESIVEKEQWLVDQGTIFLVPLPQLRAIA